MQLNTILYGSDKYIMKIKCYDNKERRRKMKVKQNPDKELAELVQRKLKENNGYCPCAIEKMPDNKCICREFRDMIENGMAGTCHCGLYISLNQG